METRTDKDILNPTRSGSAVSWVMTAGGVLWAVFGYYRFLLPHGPDVQWREDLGFSLILHNGLFVLYNLPGVFALLMTSLAAFRYVTAVHPVKRRLGSVSRALLVIAAVFGLMGAAGQLGQFDALTTGGLSFGVLFLGLALFLAGMAMTGKNTGTGRYRPIPGSALMLLGLIGMLVLLLRPLMFALQLLPLAFGAAACIAFGMGWILLAQVPGPRLRAGHDGACVPLA
ncbi:hypothetical protein AB0P28_04020 [Pseudarthrobacter sp. NPDC089323]